MGHKWVWIHTTLFFYFVKNYVCKQRKSGLSISFFVKFTAEFFASFQRGISNWQALTTARNKTNRSSVYLASADGTPYFLSQNKNENSAEAFTTFVNIYLLVSNSNAADSKSPACGCGCALQQQEKLAKPWLWRAPEQILLFIFFGERTAYLYRRCTPRRHSRMQCGASLDILQPALRYTRWILPSQELSAGCYSITSPAITLYHQIKINFRLISTSHFPLSTPKRAFLKVFVVKNPGTDQYVWFLHCASVALLTRK